MADRMWAVVYRGGYLGPIGIFIGA